MLTERVDAVLAKRIFDELPPTPVCERCGAVGFDVKVQVCRSAYADPRENVCPVYCPVCADDYHAYWDSLWDEYNASRG